MKKIFVQDGDYLQSAQDEAKKVIEDIFSEENVQIITGKVGKNILEELNESFDMIFISGSAYRRLGSYIASDFFKTKLRPNGKIVSFSCDEKYLTGSDGLYLNTDYAFFCYDFGLVCGHERKYTALKRDCLEMLRTGKTIHSKEQAIYFSEQEKIRKQQIQQKIIEYTLYVGLLIGVVYLVSIF